MTTKLVKPARALAYSASASLACCYVAYQSHDRRDLSEAEAENAYQVLTKLFPQRSVVYDNEGTCSQHLTNLDQYGVSVVKDTLTPTQVAKWNTITNEAFENTKNNIVWNSGRAHYTISKRASLFSEMASIGGNNCSKNVSRDAETASASTGGILKYIWNRKQPIDKAQTMPQRTEVVTLQDIVESYFTRHNIERYELTDIQFLNAYPKSTNQIWHRDNTCCGLTAIIALKDVRSNGPTELLTGSHRHDFSLWKTVQNVLFEGDDSGRFMLGQPLLGVIDAGDAILYDARIFHRGRGYRQSNENDRPVLVLRWDAASTPPPGAGLIKTTANTYIGCFLYAALSVVQKINSGRDSAR